jgi:predicted nuclease of predicted toxin-antitoxin system
MNILADENVDAAIVRWLRENGNEVEWVAESMPSRIDSDVLHSANASGKLLLTRDRDFGSLVFQERRAAHGIILLRIRAKNQQERLALLQAHWDNVVTNASGNFVVISNDRVRVRRLHTVL